MATAAARSPEPPADRATELGSDTGQRPGADEVAAAALSFYASMPKNGKPQPHEFTVMAGAAVLASHASVAGMPACMGWLIACKHACSV
eukprot:83096-Chlamydomonas_euryale.AAC.4